MEMLDIRTPDGEITGETVERSKAHELGILHGTSHVWLIRRKSDNSFDLLLQKRSAHKDSYPGCYDISSAGHIPSGQDYISSAVRELYEELGIQISPHKLDFIGMREGMKESIFYGKPFKDHEISAVYMLETNRTEADFNLQQEEVESVLWMDFDKCMEMVRAKEIPCCVYPDEFAMLEQAVRGSASIK